MTKSGLSPAGDDYYAIYRRGLIERHIADNGRLMQAVWLVESDPSAPNQRFGAVARHTEEQYQTSGEVVEYYAVPVQLGDAGSHVPGGGDNPLLYGGLALATLAIEAKHRLNQQSFEHATRLFHYFLASELHLSGEPTGYLLRRRHAWAKSRPASTDELCGFLIGCFYFIKAAQELGRVVEAERAIGMLRRVASYLREHDYVYDPPAAAGVVAETSKSLACIFQFPFGCIFQDVLGDAYQSAVTVPAVSIVDDGSFASGLLTTLSSFLHVGYSPQELFIDTLRAAPVIYTASAGENFYNLTMMAHAILMVLVSNAHRRDKHDVAEEGSRFFAICAHSPGEEGYDNAYFGVVARLCLEHGSPRPLGGLGGFTDLFVPALCAGLSALEGASVQYVKKQRKSCADREEREVDECQESREVLQYVCNEWEKETSRQCSDWWSWVCHAYVWVGERSCRALAWVAVKVCVLWAKVKKWVCTGWTYFVAFSVALVSGTGKLLACRPGPEWRIRVQEMIAPLLRPEGRWFHALPLGEPKDWEGHNVSRFVHAGNHGLFLGGDTFTWQHADPQHSFTYAKRWRIGKATDELGPPAPETLDALPTAEDYTVLADRGLRLESCGLDLLFPRILLTEWNLAKPPKLESTELCAHLPVAGPQALEV